LVQRCVGRGDKGERACEDLIPCFHPHGSQRQVKPRRPAAHGTRQRRPHARGKQLLELRYARAERELPRAQHLDHSPLLRLAQHRLGQRDRLLCHQAAPCVLPGLTPALVCSAGRRPGCIPYSSESTSASQEAAMTFSETPIVPHASWPSEASISTRVTAPVPFVSSRMRTLKLTSSISRRCGCSSPIASRSAASRACTGPLPSAVRTKRSPPSQILIVASVATLPSARFSTSTRQDSRRNSGSYAPASLRISSSNEPSAASN